MTARMEVVELLHDMDWETIYDGDKISSPDLWRHQDGRPLTSHETDTVGNATIEELEAVAVLAQTMAEAELTRMDEIERLNGRIQGYFRRHPEVRNTGELWPHLTAEERDDFRQLIILCTDPEITTTRTVRRDR